MEVNTSALWVKLLQNNGKFVLCYVEQIKTIQVISTTYFSYIKHYDLSIFMIN